jgi:SAM-dependent methyltransferase
MDEDALVKEQIEYYRSRAPAYDAPTPLSTSAFASDTRQVEQALDRFRPLGSVLEIASGTGNWTLQLLRHASSITALDSSPEMHDLGRAKTGGDPRVRYLTGDVFSWEPDATYDVVFFANWLSHVPPGRFERFWETVRAALAPQGRVFFTDEIEDAWKREELLREDFVVDPSVPVVNRSLPDGRNFQVVKVFWNPDDLGAALRAIGWEAVIHPAALLYWAEASPA